MEHWSDDSGFDVFSQNSNTPLLQHSGLGSVSMANSFIWLKDQIRDAFKITDRTMRARAVDIIDYEVEELDNIFGILVLGAFVGIPSPPIYISTQLLPLMEQELGVMLSKVATAHDPLGELFSVLGID